MVGLGFVAVLFGNLILVVFDTAMDGKIVPLYILSRVVRAPKKDSG